MNRLQIIGLCLLVPFFISVIIFVVWWIVEEIKDNPIYFVSYIVVIMAIAGAVLLWLGM